MQIRTLSLHTPLSRFVAICAFSATLALTQTAAAENAVSVPDLYQNASKLVMEAEQIRLVLGVRAPRERRFKLQDAEPRQVYFQAQTLFRKCNVLAQEIAGVSRQAPQPAPDRDIEAADVQAVLDAAREQLSLVQNALRITEPTTMPRPMRSPKAADVMKQIVDAGYILNELSTEKPDWSQIYDRVYQAITYIGGTLPEDTRYPALNEFECCKLPQDVYQQLLATMERARGLAARHDLTLVRIIADKQAEGGPDPSTVYDLTTTLVSDFGELTLRMDGEDIVGPDYPRPVRILPSHVFQLALALDEQIKRLNAR